jgi:hypothetical protein
VTDSHNLSFFGQSTGMFIQSTSKEEAFIFLQFIKKKHDRVWEKTSLREGKRVKCNLEEMVMILEVLKKNSKTWTTVHQFKEEKTPISVNWEGETKLWFNVGEYPKMLTFAQIEILRRLMEHLLHEKIEFATTGGSKSSKLPVAIYEKNIIKPHPEPQGVELNVIEEIDLGDKIVKITGRIKGETPKALLIDVNNGEENWFPKSVIKSSVEFNSDAEQSFLVDSWFVEKNKIGTSIAS